jgi:predicted dehydrogenase
MIRPSHQCQTLILSYFFVDERKGFPKSMVTAAIIGISGFGTTHYKDLLRQIERGTLRLLAATVINQDEEAEKCARLQALGVTLFTDYQAMLDQFRGQIDLCFIPTSLHLHAPMAIAAMRAGANAFIEKPAAATIQDVRAMQACERETGRFVAVGYQTMYAWETLWMKQAILEKQIGELQAIKCRALWPRLDSYYARNGWAGRLKVNGTWVLDSPFNNAVAHQLNMICFLAGTGLTRSANLESVEAELYRAHPIESPDTACLRAITHENVSLYFLVTHCSEETFGPEIIVRGDKGSIRWTTERVWIERADGTSEERECETGQQLRDSIMAHLFQRLADPQTFICDLSIAGTHTLCVNSVHESSAIHALDDELISRFPYDGSIKTVIKGIDDVIARSFTQEKLFSELDIPWARRGEVVPLEGFSVFPRSQLAHE